METNFPELLKRVWVFMSDCRLGFNCDRRRQGVTGETEGRDNGGREGERRPV